MYARWEIEESLFDIRLKSFVRVAHHGLRFDDVNRLHFSPQYAKNYLS